MHDRAARCIHQPSEQAFAGLQEKTTRQLEKLGAYVELSRSRANTVQKAVSCVVAKLIRINPPGLRTA